MHAMQIAELGGPEVLEWVTVPRPEPGAGDLLVHVEAAGINFIDIYQRSGLYPRDLPFTLGLEGAGTVVEVGPGSDGFEVGQRVAWATAPGSYAEYALVPAEVAVHVPDAVALDVAAAVMLQGMTAHFLAMDTYPLDAGEKCLIHAGAGGVGLLLIQVAKLLGAEVFATVSTDEKASLASEAGADHVINYTEGDFGDAVEEIVGPKALDVVYDGVGADTFDRGLELLRPRGLMALFGQSSGVVKPLDLGKLARFGSLYVTRPSLFVYIAQRVELERRAADVFEWIASGQLNVRIGARFPLSGAADAHRALEARETTGKVLLEP
ncbi:MAG: quinone oxidoreductase [Acidimicrobiia bacterium]|nr:quinone oxidoreductase [Acidimicrobiia bacterium]